MSNEDAENMLDAIASRIGEHFDHVQILATWNDSGISKNLYRGTGNWFARQGMAHDFIQQDISQESATQISNALKEPPDNEQWPNQE